MSDGEGVGPGAQALIDMARYVGEVAGAQRHIGQQLGQVASTLEELAATNAVDHRETAANLASIDARLAEGDRRFMEHDERLKALEKQKPDKGNGTKLADVLATAKTYGPLILGALVAFYAWITGQQPPKGGSAP